MRLIDYLQMENLFRKNHSELFGILKKTSKLLEFITTTQ